MTEEDETLSGAASPTGEMTISTNEGHFFYALNEMKKDIIGKLSEKVESGFQEQRKEFSAQMEAVSTKIAEQVAQEVDTYVSVPDGSKSSDQNSKFRAPRISLPRFQDVAGNKQAVVPFLQWTSLATVVSFSNRVAGMRGWIPEKVYTKNLANSLDVICGASGLSAVLFSVKRNEARLEKLECPVGRLWSFILRNAMVSVLRNGMIYLFDAEDNDISKKRGVDEDGSALGTDAATPTKSDRPPSWLSSFGKRGSTTMAVNAAVDRLEGQEEAGPLLKKRKVIESTETTGDARAAEEVERTEERRFHAVKQMRSCYMTMMNHGRTEVRAHLFTELLFLTERIAKFASVTEAKQKGFEILFAQGSVEEHNTVASDGLKGSIWDIPVARTVCVGVGKSRTGSNATENDLAHVVNREGIRIVQKRFPSLYVTLKYMKNVHCPPSECTENTEDLTWPVEERVSLHRVATGVLMEIYKAGSHDIVLSSSQHSIKAVHVMAIGLRGLLRQCLGQELSEIECIALGEVKHTQVRKGDTSVTAMMDMKMKKDAKALSRVEKIRLRKFSMTWAEYLKEKCRKDEEERRRTLATAPSLGDDESDDDDDIFLNE